jgi:hypothetical protein
MSQRPCKDQGVFNSYKNSQIFLGSLRDARSTNNKITKVQKFGEYDDTKFKGFNFEMKAHFSQFEIFITKVLS